MTHLARRFDQTKPLVAKHRSKTLQLDINDLTYYHKNKITFCGVLGFFGV